MTVFLMLVVPNGGHEYFCVFIFGDEKANRNAAMLIRIGDCRVVHPTLR